MRTTACFDFNHTIRTTRTPDSRCGSVLQDVDAGDVFRVDLQQVSKLFFVHIVSVELLRVIVLKDVSVDNDQRFLITIDRGNTTQTHAGTGTKVT